MLTRTARSEKSFGPKTLVTIEYESETADATVFSTGPCSRKEIVAFCGIAFRRPQSEIINEIQKANQVGQKSIFRCPNQLDWSAPLQIGAAAVMGLQCWPTCNQCADGMSYWQPSPTENEAPKRHCCSAEGHSLVRHSSEFPATGWSFGRIGSPVLNNEDWLAEPEGFEPSIRL